jgi:hypothetical protein
LDSSPAHLPGRPQTSANGGNRENSRKGFTVPPTHTPREWAPALGVHESYMGWGGGGKTTGHKGRLDFVTEPVRGDEVQLQRLRRGIKTDFTTALGGARKGEMLNGGGQPTAPRGPAGEVLA